MSQSSILLQTLLSQLAQAKRGTALALSKDTLGQTAAAPLLDLFSAQLGIPSFALDTVDLPSTVDGLAFTATGAGRGLDVTLAFQDVLGDVAIEIVFSAAATATLTKAFPALPSTFYSAITAVAGGASIAVPGLAPTIVIASPAYGVVGLSAPSSGLVTNTVAPRVAGQFAPKGTAKGLACEAPTDTSGWRLFPTDTTWGLDDLAALAGLDVRGAFPPIIPTRVGLRTFDLNLYPDAPAFSSISVDVFDPTTPDAALWSAMSGKIQLTDVTVTAALTYSQTYALSLAGTGSVTGTFMLGSLELQVEIPFPLTGVWAITAYPNLSLKVLDDVATLLPQGAAQLDDLLPAGLSALGDFELTYLRIAVDAAAFQLVEFTFAFGSTTVWKLVPDVVEIASVQLRMTIDGTPSVKGYIAGLIELPEHGEIAVTFGRDTPTLPWRLDVVSPAIALPSLGDLAQLAQGTNLAAMVQAGGLGQLHFVMTNLNFGLTVAPFALSNFGLTLQLASGDPNNPLSTKLDWVLIPNVLTLTEFSFGFQLQWGAKPSKDVFGTFVMNDLEFAIRFGQQGTADALIAEYVALDGAGSVDVKHDLIAPIAPSVAALLPDGLVIDVDDALLAYINTDTKKFVFAMDVSIEFPLSDLPLVGKSLPADAMVGIKKLKVVVASAPLTADDVTLVNSLAPQAVLPSPKAGTTGPAVPKGFSMVAELELGSLSLLVTSPPAQTSQTSTLALLTVRDAAAPAADPTMWIDVQKTFGPVSIQKVGFAYKDGALFVLSNLALAVGPLEIDLIGIGIGSPIKDPSLRFTIQGLAVAFTAGPISVMGGMIGTLDPVDFVGALSVRGPELALSAFAGYAVYQDHPSFFLYGVLDAPIGGPPAFFVTGVAAGMGFNRKLVIPDVSGVQTFPLVAWATGSGAPSMDPTKPIGDQVGDALDRLAKSGVVAPSVGDYWFAAGIQFTSFEIVSSFALITVSLGTTVEIALLGLSTLVLPPGDTANPVAEIQLALEVSFSYDKGLLAVAGQLTNNSYVLSRDARLTGGFAFYLWFRGDHAGETVLTLGGYNPNFAVPSYYPVVPRLGLSWRIGGELSITGGLYFALTSNAVMAGGKLSAVWSSGPIRAWFTYWADFLMTFSPFHYYIDGGIDLGASFTVDCWLFTISVTIHVGIGIELWGPTFAGKATVDLSIISFTIKFGDQTQNTDTRIEWGTFQTQLLPQQGSSTQSPRALRSRRSQKLARRGRFVQLADDPPPDPAAVQINVTSGLTRTLAPDANGPVYLVSAEAVQLAVITVIPSKSITFAADPDHATFQNIAWDAVQPLDKDGKPIVASQDIGVGPSNIAPKDFQPALALTITSEADSVFHAVKRFANAPKALWEPKTFTPQGVPQVSPTTGLTSTTIPNALVGVTLTPYLDVVVPLAPVPLESLLFTLDADERWAWSPAAPPTSDPFTTETVAGTIATSAVGNVRTALLGALAAQHVTVTTTVDVSRVADGLTAAPRLQLLGEQKAA